MPADNIYQDRLIGGTFVLNGAGELAGLTQVSEWGLIETPILLTNTMSVGKVSDAVVKWLTKKHPGIGSDEDAQTISAIGLLRRAGHANIARAGRYYAAHPAEALALLGLPTQN